MNDALGGRGSAEVRARVLVVDDHVTVLTLVAQMVEKEFTVAAVVTDAEALIATWADARPDVIVLDISLPTITGLEAALRVRRQGCEAAVVFLSVYRIIRDRARGVGGRRSGICRQTRCRRRPVAGDPGGAAWRTVRVGEHRSRLTVCEGREIGTRAVPLAAGTA